jgi:DNA-binding transcriptional LysR family regulator
MKDLAFDDLQLFVRVALLGTLSAAARERNVPVSLVSRALSRIEKACGARLVRRSTHGLSLTAEGDAFLTHCHRICRTLDDMEAEFAHRTAEVSGLVRLSVSTVMAQYWVVPALPALTRQYPQLAVELVVDDRRVDIVREGIDIAIRTGEPTSDTLVMRPLGQLYTGLFASPGYLQSHGEPHAVDALGEHRLLSNCAHPVLNQWSFTEGRTMEATGAVRADNTAIIVAMALQGLGIARLPLFVGTPLVRQGLLVPVLAGELQAPPVPVSAVLPAERQRLPRIRACVDHLAAFFSDETEACPVGGPVQRTGTSAGSL